MNHFCLTRRADKEKGNYPAVFKSDDVKRQSLVASVPGSGKDSQIQRLLSETYYCIRRIEPEAASRQRTQHSKNCGWRAWRIPEDKEAG